MDGVTAVDRLTAGGRMRLAEADRQAHLLGPEDPNLPPDWCPGGCALDKTHGSCVPELAAPGPHRRWCPGVSAFVCVSAFEAWKAAGRIQLTGAATLARIGERPYLPPEPAAPPVPRPLPPSLASAPADWAAWELYAPHVVGASGWEDEQQRDVLNLLRGWDQDWLKAAREMPWLLLVGPCGRGKTFLLRIFARRAHEAGLRVGFADFRQALLRIKATRAPDADTTEEAVLEKIAGLDLLILDDVRPVFGTQDDENIAHEIVRRRHGEDFGTPSRLTWFSANLTLSELEPVLGAAALSRVKGRSRLVVCDWQEHPSRTLKSSP